MQTVCCTWERQYGLIPRAYLLSQPCLLACHYPSSACHPTKSWLVQSQPQHSTPLFRGGASCTQSSRHRRCLAPHSARRWRPGGGFSSCALTLAVVGTIHTVVSSLLLQGLGLCQLGGGLGIPNLLLLLLLLLLALLALLLLLLIQVLLVVLLLDYWPLVRRLPLLRLLIRLL